MKNLAYLEGGAYDKWHRDTASKENYSNKGDTGRISSAISDPNLAFIPIGHYAESGIGGPGE